MRTILGPGGIGLKLRHVLNLSWVTSLVLEMIVLEEYVDGICRRIETKEGVRILWNFNPFLQGNFPCLGDIRPDSALTVLEQSFVSRLALSSVTSTNFLFKRFLHQYMRERDWKAEFEVEINRQMTKQSPPPFPNIPNSPSRKFHEPPTRGMDDLFSDASQISSLRRQWPHQASPNKMLPPTVTTTSGSRKMQRPFQK